MRRRSNRRDFWSRWLIGGLLAACAARTLGFADPGDTDLVVYFSNTDGIYAGDEVRVLGVPVGEIDKITPDDEGVRVDLHVDGDVAIPAEAKAAIVAPSLVSSRYIQLAPRYDGGAKLKDGGEIPMERTAVPVEWDVVKGQLNDLVTALGPRGANKNGALGRLVDSSSRALDGQGSTINQTIADLASAVETLDEGSDNAFSTLQNLQVFIGALRQSDAQLAAFIENLDAVSDVLADDDRQIRATLRDLGVTVEKVERFVRTNRSELKRSVRGLGGVISVLAGQQEHLGQTLHVGPSTLENLTEIYHERQNSLAVNLVGANLHAPGQLICGALAGLTSGDQQQSEQLCKQLIGDLLDRASQSPETQQLLGALLNGGM